MVALAREDLIPFNKRTEDEQKQIATAGGIASGAARRRKRSLREAADLYLSLPPADRRSWNKLARRGLEPEEIDNQMAVIVGLTERAVLGDAKAAKVLFDLLGESAAAPEEPPAEAPVPLSEREDLLRGLAEAFGNGGQ